MMTAHDDNNERARLEAEADATRARLIDTLDRLDGRPDNVFHPADMARTYALRAALAAGVAVSVGTAAILLVRSLNRSHAPPSVLDRVLPPPHPSLSKHASQIVFGMATQAAVHVGLQWLAKQADAAQVTTPRKPLRAPVVRLRPRLVRSFVATAAVAVGLPP